MWHENEFNKIVKIINKIPTIKQSLITLDVITITNYRYDLEQEEDSRTISVDGERTVLPLFPATPTGDDTDIDISVDVGELEDEVNLLERLFSFALTSTSLQILPSSIPTFVECILAGTMQLHKKPKDHQKNLKSYNSILKSVNVSSRP